MTKQQRVRVTDDAPYWQGREGIYKGLDRKGRVEIQKRKTIKDPVVNFYVLPQFIEFLE